MQDKNNRTTYILLAVAVLAILGGVIALFTWGTGGNATPTINVGDIYTSAAQTVSAQQATLQASNPPTLSPPLPTFPVATSPAPAAPTSISLPTLPAITSPTSGSVPGCDSGVYVSDVTIPDNTVMAPGQKFVKTWLLQNSGSCTWDTNYKLTLVSGDAMSGATTPLTLSVPPGQQIKVSVNMVAPSDAGKSTGTWQLVNGNGVNFGSQISVLIKVVLPTDTPVPPTVAATP